MAKEVDFLFEVSWEVCNKVGGIYTVVKSKEATMHSVYKDNYFLVGPYFHDKAHGEFLEHVPCECLKSAFESLKAEGIHCHFGKWLLPSEPNVILIDYTGYASRKNEIKSKLWDHFKIDSLNTSYFDFDEPIVWSWAVGVLLDHFKKANPNAKTVAQFHEWLAGGGLLYIKSNKVPVATVFTTHATMLGRTLASANIDLYNDLSSINPQQAAYQHGIQAKYLTEKACAHNADVFTTVSEITSIEAEKLLEKKADIILPNGLDISKFPTIEEIAIKHKLYKNRIKEFIMYYFFPYYSFDLNNTIIYYLCGRYEFHDKGIDIAIKALGQVNERLKQEKSNKTVVTFFWVPGNIRGIKPELLANKFTYMDLRDSLDDSMDDIKTNLLHTQVAGKKINDKTLFSEELQQELKVKQLKFKKSGNPPLSTHDLFDENTDAIIRAFKENGLNNKDDDRVKVIFYSIYLTGADGLLDTSYYESMLGSHLGMFPSFYEPWGYTPLESGALGIPAVTTDLAGFGRYIYEDTKKTKNPGIFVLKRLGKTDDAVVKNFADLLYKYAKLDKQTRMENKIHARELAEKEDWKLLADNYFKAHELALKKAKLV